MGARFESKREGEVIGVGRGEEHLAVEVDGMEGISSVEVASHKGVKDEGGRVSEGVEDLLGVLEAPMVRDGVEFGEAAGGVGVGGLGGFDHEGMDLVGLLEVGAELEEGEV